MSEHDFVSVYRAADEITANIVRIAIEGEGIPAVVRPRETCWLDGVPAAAEGAWGDVMVPADRAEEAAKVLAAFEASENEPIEIEGESGDVQGGAEDTFGRSDNITGD